MDPKQKVLLVCDDPEIGKQWVLYLHGSQLDSVLVTDSVQVIEIWAKEIPDLVVIDEVRGKFDPIKMIRSLRENSIVPILLMTLSTNETVLLNAYEAGADECVIKPVSPLLFMAKVRSLLKRSREIPIEELDVLRTGNLSLDPKLRQLELGSGVKIKLTVLEFRLMFLLMGNPKKSISTNELIERVWGLHDFGSGAMVKNVVYRLRKKIEANPNEPVHLFTDTGFGYRFEP